MSVYRLTLSVNYCIKLSEYIKDLERGIQLLTLYKRSTEYISKSFDSDYLIKH
jgi:hypothetical protein